MEVWHDEDISLLLLEERHAGALFALYDVDREHLRAWLPWVDGSTSVEDAKAFIRQSLTSLAETGSASLGIWYRGELAGGIGFHVRGSGAPFHKMEIGYWLNSEHEGRGIMTRACRGLTGYIFGELEVNRIEIRCATENMRSRAIPERLGFTYEGTLRQSERHYDDFLDMRVYALLRDDWKEVERPQ